MKKVQNSKIFLWVLKVFVVWRVLLFAFALLGQKLLVFKESFPYIYKLTPYGNPLLWSWANFDGVHYLGIVYEGYYAKFTQAFFPLYPLLIRFLDPIFRNFIIDGLFVSNICILIALFIFYKLILLDYSEQIAKKSILFLLVFPTSFFLGAFYNESIFLVFVLSSFYFARQKKWFLAGFFGIFASLTRFVGIVLIPSLILEVFVLKGKFKKKLIPLLLSLLPALGLLGYMYYLQTDMGDPLFFVHAQTAFKVSRTTEKIVLLYQVFYRYIKMLLTVDIHQWLYFSVVFEFFSGLLFISLLIYGYLKKIRPSYLLYGILVYMIPTFTGTLTSMPRYALTIFPAFIALSLIKNRWVTVILSVLFILTFGLSIMLFTRGYWVA
jgi:Gpi18-like mannosyltransferase